MKVSNEFLRLTLSLCQFPKFCHEVVRDSQGKLNIKYP